MPSSSSQIQTTIFSGRVWKYGDHVNTDVIFPGKYTYTIARGPELAEHALEDLDPSFASEVQAGDIVVAGINWGCGSSREQAVTCLTEAGVQVIVAASFSRIYYRNAVNSGLLPIISPLAVQAIQAGEAIKVDLGSHQIHCSEGVYSFPPLSPSLRAILDAGGLIPMLQVQFAEA
ncbi:MAG: 3-isopropylmalate dehydratase [Chloroflexi bacterium]|nr:3-isopropylmalate dehydratase [Chloroflexota bacterium]